MAAYTVLYRKFRPTEFSEVKGQDAIVKTLKNQIKTGRIGHAYLLCGTRGTGKTTLAKIFAKAANCEHPVDGNPCGECASCRAIAAGTSMDVVEIDGASNNGVDNIRQLREDVKYPPANSKYRVYIIDEAHMITQQAFNALLKTLEEPPSYIIFILATTDPNRLPVTILSRCQRYNLKRIPADIVADRLSEILTAEGIDAENKALRYLAKTADGSFRDALSLLEECISYYAGEKLTYERVLDVLGAVDTVVYRELLCNIVAKDTAKCMELVEEMVMSGRELGQFVTEFIWYLRNLLLLKTSKHGGDLIDVSEERQEGMREEADIVEVPELMRFIRIFSDLENEMKFAASKRVLLEIAMIRLMKPEMERDLSAAYGRIANLERRLKAVENGSPAGNPGSGTMNPPEGAYGTAGYSGTDGAVGFSGYDGAADSAGFPGTGSAAGFSGYSGGNGAVGFTGYPGTDGASGFGEYPDAGQNASPGAAAGRSEGAASGSAAGTDGAAAGGTGKTRSLDPATRENLERLREIFQDRIVSKTDGMMKVKLCGCTPVPSGEDHLVLTFPKNPLQDSNMGYEYMARPEKIQVLENIIAEETGKKVYVEVKLVEQGRETEDAFDASLKNINWDIIEDVEE
ncbi:MAG: DNA polymerase III subunit gamma/tau [Lachnospiraceae bacterium]|nr:DNA polymerase III subunit gamma/tau [Lachnospiraceae bacterium]